MRKWFAGCIIIMQIIAFKSSAQDSYTERANKYILKYNVLAIEEQNKTGIPASITLAQGILETEAGASELATKANNHFGIKCKSDWKGQTFSYTDDAPDECFRKYSSAEESYHDHSVYLATTPRYTSLFSLPPTDYKAWAHGLKRCGYATSPTYAQRLIKIVEDFNLQDYTLIAINQHLHIDKPPKETNTQSDIATPVVEVENDNVPPKADQNFVAGQLIHVNGLKAIYAFKGETLLKYAVQYNMRYEHLLEINDLQDAPLPCNMYIYLEKKNYRGSRETHTVKPGETMQQISQLEGVQLRRLMMLNRIPKMGDEPVPGTVLELQKIADKKPQLLTGKQQRIMERPEAKNNPVNTNTAQVNNKPLDYIYKSTTTQQNNTNQKPLTAYVQKGNEIQKVELNNQQKLSNPSAIGNPIKTSIVPPVAKSPTVMIENVTVIEPNDKKLPNTINTITDTKTSPDSSTTKTVIKTDITNPTSKIKNVTTTTVINKAPMATQQPVVEAPPVVNKIPVVTEHPVVNKTPIVTQQPVAPTPPVVNKELEITKAPVVTQEVTPPQVTQKVTAPVAENKDEEKDPLVALKEKLDKVVYKDEKKNVDNDNNKQTAPVVAPTVTTIDKPVVQANPEDVKYYIVKKGETAYGIAKQNNITLRQLLDWNNMDFDEVKVGQRLRVKP